MMIAGAEHGYPASSSVVGPATAVMMGAPSALTTGTVTGTRERRCIRSSAFSSTSSVVLYGMNVLLCSTDAVVFDALPSELRPGKASRPISRFVDNWREVHLELAV